MTIRSLRLKHFGIFDDLSLQLDPHINVLTGANNTGKSTILLALADICVFPFAAPQRFLRKDASAQFRISYRVGQASRPRTASGELPININWIAGMPKGDNQWLKILDSLGYSLFVPPLRRGTEFRSEGPQGSEKKRTRRRARELASTMPERLTSYERELLQAEVGDINEPAVLARRRAASFGETDSTLEDRPIIQKIIDLDYRAYRKNEPRFREAIEDIVSLVSEITSGFEMAFAGVEEDERGLFPVIRTPDGVLPLHVLSQGTQSLILWIARLVLGMAEFHNFPRGLRSKPGRLIIDEIDAHIHPSWQRRILPALQLYFPKVQVICSTHSPLMLSGLAAGQIHLLRRDDNGKVCSSTNTSDIEGWTLDEIARNLLGVPVATDTKTEDLLDRLTRLRNKVSLTPTEKLELAELRKQLVSALQGAPTSNKADQVAEVLSKELLPAGKPRGKAAARRKRKA